MRAINWVRWCFVAIFIVALAGPAIVVALGGLTVVEVDGRSMEPTIKYGDVVVIREPRPSDFVVDSVVTAVDSAGAKYTHRIVGLEDDGDLLLRGDNNTVDDPAPVPRDAVIGVVDGQFTGPAATFVVQLQGWPLRVCLLVMIIALVFLPLPTFSRTASTAAAPAANTGRRARRVTGIEPASQTQAESHAPIPERERLEALELVDSMRSSMARVLLASERRLAGRITVTTTTSANGPFPLLRVVIDVEEKAAAPASRTAVSAAAPTQQPQSRRERRNLQTEPREVLEPRVPQQPSLQAMDPADAAALLWTRAAGSVPADLPTRRSQRDGQRHGRRRASR